MKVRSSTLARFRSIAVLAAFSLAPAIKAQIVTDPFGAQDEETRHEKAAVELHEEEQQRILGVMPNFNTSYIPNAEPLSASQKLQLALKTALDPVTFLAAGFDAGLSQAENSFGAYGQGARGYSKRLGASYADTFDGTLLGNAVFPILFKQDPRYFRKGTGSFGSRLAHALESAAICKNDAGQWVPNYSNVLGNIAAGGISNLYYPADDRGVGLTLQRALVVTAEGSAGAIFAEFWPDISRKMFAKRHRGESVSAVDDHGSN
jgi:hypothetical protein